MNKEDKILEDQAWVKMEAILDQEMPVTKKRPIGLFWWIGVSALILVSVFTYLYIDNFVDQSMVKVELENQLLVEDQKEEIQFKESENVSLVNVESINSNEEITIDVEVLNDVDVKKSNLLTNNLPVLSEGISEVIASEKNKSTSKFNAQRNLVNKAVLDKKERPQKYNQSVNKNNLTTLGRKDTKALLNQEFEEDYSTIGFKKKGEDLNTDIEIAIAVEDREEITSVDKLPLNTSCLFSEMEEFKLSNDRLIKVNEERGRWMFGSFASYQHLDKYFKGYDLGLVATYNLGRLSFNMKWGYEKLHNTEDPVLGNALVGVLVSDIDPSLADNELSVLNGAKNAGFELNDFILEKSNFMTEFTVSFKVYRRFGFSTGIGYKRLVGVETRPIGGFTLSDSQLDFNPDLELNVLNGNKVLSSPSVNRNRLYVPIEIDFCLAKNVAIGLGTQFYINNAFEQFDEKNKSLYARLILKF